METSGILVTCRFLIWLLVPRACLVCEKLPSHLLTKMCLPFLPPGDKCVCACVCVCVCTHVLSHFSHVQHFVTHGLQSTRILYQWNSPGKKAGVSCHSFLQGIFLIQGSNPGLWHCRQILYRLSYQGNPFLCIIYIKYTLRKNRITHYN